MTARGDFYLLRLIATGASFSLFGLGGVVLGYIVFPVVSLVSSSTEVERRRCRKMVQLCFRGFVWFMKTFGVLTWEVSGREKLKLPGQLIVANHPSLIDIVFLIAMIPNASCIVKPELYRNIFTRGPVSRAGYIASDTPESLIENCVQQLDSGASLVVFPEGTRSVSGQTLRFKRGAAYVQLQSGCEVVLASIQTTPPTFLAKHKKWYQIPATRPHCRLLIEEDVTGNSEQLDQDAVISPRLLTRQWRDYFINEVVV